MTWRDLKIRNKVGLGFGTVVLLSVVASLILLVNLLKVNTEINTLSNKHIPSVNESSKMDRFWENTNGNLNAFDLSGNPYYMQLANNQFDSFVKALDILIELSDTTETNNKDGVDLTNLKKLATQFKIHNQKASSSEIEVQDKLEEINQLFYELNEVAKKHSGSFATQSVLAKANRMHLELFSYTNSKSVIGLSLLEDELQNISKTGGLPRELKEIVNNITNSISTFIPQYRSAKLLELKRFEKAKDLMWEVRKASELGQDGLLELGENSASLIGLGKEILIASIIIVLALGLILSYSLANSITKPLENGILLAEKAANGDLNISFSSDSKDEVGRLSKALDTMVGNIKKVVDEISISASKMVNASEKLTKESSELSEGASEQASAAEEVSSSMEEMYANIQQNTDNSKETERIAVNAVEGMKISNKSSEEAKNYIEDITEKISIIGDIAFQTNILALNAAVEAARAGQEGRGFAVVAAEVRKLAERSQQAASDINTASQNTLSSSNEARDNLVQITPEIEKTAMLVQEITSASLEQVAGVEQINNALQQLNQITQRNASNSEEISSAAKVLEELSVNLKQSISVFNVEDERIKAAKHKTQSKHTKKSSAVNKSFSNNNHNTEKPVIDLNKELENNDYETF